MPRVPEARWALRVRPRGAGYTTPRHSLAWSLPCPRCHGAGYQHAGYYRRALRRRERDAVRRIRRRGVAPFRRAALRRPREARRGARRRAARRPRIGRCGAPHSKHCSKHGARSRIFAAQLRDAHRSRSVFDGTRGLMDDRDSGRQAAPSAAGASSPSAAATAAGAGTPLSPLERRYVGAAPARAPSAPCARPLVH